MNATLPIWAALAACLLAALGLPAPPCLAAEPLVHESFDTLAHWRPRSFPRVERQTTYGIVLDEGGESVLMAVCNASASALVHTGEFDVRDTPWLSWRWRVSGVFERGDATRASGDDYPARVYVMFAYDPNAAGFGQRIAFGALKLLYGEYPPEASLTYIWANRPHSPSEVIPSPYTSQSMMIPLRSGSSGAGAWHTERVNLLSDFRRAFPDRGTPPSRASLAVMCDADNTGESAQSWFDDITLSPP
jgi:hypothetical protein